MHVSFILLVSLCAAGLGWVLRRPERIFTDRVNCVAVTVFILPQPVL